MSQSSSPVWFITGCSTGFGRELARLVLERGWRAVVTARNPAQVADLVQGHEDNAIASKLDVTEKGQVAAAAKAAHYRFGQVDVLVNNAGYGYLAAIEEGEDPEVRNMFEANFFGLVAMTRAMLPGMRARHSGAIVNISSIGGIASFPATGYYHATKYAVEGMSESLAQEVGPLGIKVVIVEPGPFRTNWAGSSIKQSATRIPDYEATAGVRRGDHLLQPGARPDVSQCRHHGHLRRVQTLVGHRDRDQHTGLGGQPKARQRLVCEPFVRGRQLHRAGLRGRNPVSEEIGVAAGGRRSECAAA